MGWTHVRALHLTHTDDEDGCGGWVDGRWVALIGAALVINLSGPSTYFPMSGSLRRHTLREFINDSPMGLLTSIGLFQETVN